MVDARCARFLLTLGWPGAGRQYAPLERADELETLVSPDAPARGSDPLFSRGPPHRTLRPGPRPAPLQPAASPRFFLERSRLRRDAGARFCSGPGAPAAQRPSAGPLCRVRREAESG